MTREQDLAIRQMELGNILDHRADFKAYAHDVSEATLFALERRHLEYLDLSHVPPPPALPPAALNEIFFLKVGRIGHSAAIDRSLDVLNMQNVVGLFRDRSHSLIVGLASDGDRSHFYLGARRSPTTAQIHAGSFEFKENFRRAIEGNLPGTRFQEFTPEEQARHIQWPIQRHLDYPYLAAITGIPSLRAERQDQYAQSLDRLIQALQGQRYLMLIIAEPLAERKVNQILSNCLRLGSEVHSLVRVSANFARAIGDSVAKARAEGKVHNESEALSIAKGTSQGLSTQTHNVASGVIGAAVGLGLNAILPGIGLQLGSLGAQALMGVAGRQIGSRNEEESENTSTSRSRAWGDSFTQSLTESSSKTETASMNMEYLNKTADYCEKILDGYIRRLQEGKNLGMWNVGIYFFADNPATLAQGRTQLCSLYSGKNTHYEPMRSLDLSQPEDLRRNIGEVLSRFYNPSFELQDPSTGEALPHPLSDLHRGISTPLNTEELALTLNPPRREVPGLELELVADFGVNPAPLESEDAPTLGTVVSCGVELNLPVGIPIRDLNRHVFVTGITGSGKTNTCFALVKMIRQKRLPFLAIEPAKGEYRLLLRNIPDLQIYTLGDERIAPFRINPFQFVPGMNLVTHIDNLKAIFNAAFPMYAAMPYMLEEAILRCYTERGWRLEDSSHQTLDMAEVERKWSRGEFDYEYTLHLPTLADLLTMVDKVVDSKGYAEEARQNYGAALRARVKSLLLGSKGPMFQSRCGVPYEQLYGQPTVLELRSLGDDDEKCFLMALLLVQLYEFREQSYQWDPKPGLRHVTIIEESHRLLSASRGGGSAETADPRGKAVEAFANMLAEIREYGQGFLIVDQTPAKLVPDVLKNTSTKILHSVKARDDCEAMGDAMGMTEEQKRIIPRLRIGNAIFHTESQDKPIWIKIHAMKGGNRLPVTNHDVQQAMKSVLERRHLQTAKERQAEDQALTELGNQAFGGLADKWAQDAQPQRGA
jgi:hypothetical protein